ncbi:flavoprotein [Cryptococcus neoformans var. grubii Br795]|nr:flavoprotein [Cryptococcus neoformans var. grubii AD1-83a]OXG48646.1 flavoprotein [Cryptococcus neoformans var. grubii MW-RSA1955]OXG52288.1 flavoprotein [Cryptococcus neoformans var. grubii CHC193]OXG58391.1 flavoprotein [Cryptococcus neoformans var. grubii c8]OXG74730.1 flavoprotein [Cryptococcus neoformans var. grubii Br795]OXH02571.1 flavoprotein [Cryptococcus neoformans var. grubii A5-35-17]OXH04117.1 flavoprotein [Cryptococcus neoformans var. grubii A1-35-8]
MFISRLAARQARVPSHLPRHIAYRSFTSTITIGMSMNDDLLTKAVLPDNELKNGEKKAVDFGEGKVLLSKINGNVYATSAFCTHYGAPLEKGVLSHDGRLVCPWHGACFNVCSGDVEDAPGLDSLWSFSTNVKNGQIEVTASKKEVTSKVGRIVARKRTKDQVQVAEETVVIVGGGSGGIHTLESLRMNGFGGKIVLISAENYAPIDRTKMSKQLLDDVGKLQWRTPDELRDSFGVDFHPGTNVTKVDFEAQTVTDSSGVVYNYNYLVLSPGGRPKKIPIPGADLKGVVTLRHVEDTKTINSFITKDSDVVLIGTSFISMEAASAVLKKGPKSVTLVGMDEVPFQGLLGKEFGSALMENMKEQGIKFHMNAQIEKITASDSNPGHAGMLHIKGSDPIPANLVIMGTGVTPATSFLEGSVKLEKDGGVLVDEYLHLKGYKNVYAIGDIAHYIQYPDKFPRRVEHWNVASNHVRRRNCDDRTYLIDKQGREVAHNITHPENPVSYTKVPIFWSSIGKGLRYLGTGAGYDDMYVDGNFKDFKFAAYQAKGGKVTAVAAMQRDPIVSKASELMRLDLMPPLEEIKNGKDILQIELINKGQK